MEFLRQAVKDLLEEDGLVVMCRECGYRDIFSRFIKYYALKCKESSKIVFILNADNSKNLIEAELKTMTLDPSLYPTDINSKSGSVKDRQVLYKKGGVFYISSTILQLDFLQNHLPCESIAGILVFDAHQLSPGCTDLFCLLLFRHRCNGFVKCFSDNANACITVFPQLSSFLNELTVSSLYLYPRTRDTVVQSLQKYPLTMEECTFSYCSWMAKAQNCVESILHHLISELKLQHCDLNDKISLDYCFQPLFPSIINKELALHGENYNQKTRTLLSELKLVSRFSLSIHYYSIISVYERIHEAYYAAHTNFNTVSYWTECKETEELYTCIHDEIFKKTAEDDWLSLPDKWSELIKELTAINASVTETTSILLHVLNAKSAMELHNCLINPSIYMRARLQRALNRIINSDTSKHTEEQTLLKTLRTQRTLEEQEQEIDWYQHCIGYDRITQILDSGDCCIEVLTKQFSHLHLFITPCSSSSYLLNPFSTYHPSIAFVIDANYIAIRQAEFYHAKTKGKGLQTLYFYCYEGFEQHVYESELRRELHGFKRLIEERNRVIHRDIWKDIEYHMKLEDSTRNGTNKQYNQHTIIIDSREFKAELPSALYKYGFQLLPFTLNICDYILTPVIGVERKSFQDLVNSLNHGRLEKQMEHMSRVYTYPLLLIEMDLNKQGLFKNNAEVTRTAMKLIILMRSFPTMRILWSFQEHSSCHVYIVILMLFIDV